MAHYTGQDDLFAAPHSSRFLAPTKPVSRRSSRQDITQRKSSSSLRAPSSLAHALNVPGSADETSAGTSLNGAANGGGRQHSLAHELAFALMPEPSAGSKLLAEEFGIEYDEGAEGIDEPVHTATGPRAGDDDIDQEQDQEFLDQERALVNGVNEGLGVNGDDVETALGHSFADELNGMGSTGAEEETKEDEGYEIPNGSPVTSALGTKGAKPVIKVQKPEADAMDVLAQDLESTENFLRNLRKLDSDSAVSDPRSRTTSSSHQPALERYASDIIRRMDEAVRDRESQLRELLEYDREFRKIAGDVNGTEVLSRVDELPSMNDDDSDGDGDANLTSPTTLVTPTLTSSAHALDSVTEEEPTSQSEWDLDPDAQLRRELGDELFSPSDSAAPTPTKTAFSSIPPPPPIPTAAKTTPASAIPHLTHVRTFTSSLIRSLTTISEQAQVNGAATTEAGRKIKALKNKMGGWQLEWESAERSRVKIERWEAGIVDWQSRDNDESTLGNVSPSRLAARRRVDGRKLVEEYLSASVKAIKDATERTQAIMAR